MQADDRPSSPGRPVRFGVIGCGLLAQSMHLPNIVKSAKAELVACCDISEEILALCRRA